ncbi:MAG: hypothetical protein MN733_11595 [Nitrososphaera sp.]|nr:hypothetical protein [Nitrososphaera sp.]
MLDHFTQAIEAGETYVRASGATLDAKYQFIAQTYLAYWEGEQHRPEFDEMLNSRLKRKPTGPEKKRPFLHLLHGLIAEEIVAKLESHSYYSKLVTALEQIHGEFKLNDPGPTLDGVIEFIDECGGVTGLYDRSRNSRTGKASTSKATEIANLGAWIITKEGKTTRVRMPGYGPGEHDVRIKVGKDGVVEQIIVEERFQKAA